MEFKKAVKSKQKLRLAIDGVSGSGKTYTALAIASGMIESISDEKVAVIDTEHGSASLYASKFAFDTLELTAFEIEDYIEALDKAAESGYQVVIVDSTSHGWDRLVARVERIANQKYGGNTFRAWAEGTPLQNKLVEALLSYPGHVIVTCRSKTEYSVDRDDKGKTTVKKVGTAAVQRQGFEYEFTMTMSMDANHIGFVSKDRTEKFQDKFIEKPGKTFGKQLVAWLSEGADPPPPPPKPIKQQYDEALAELTNIIDTEESGERAFSLAEKTKLREDMKRELAKSPNPEYKVAYIKKVLEEQKTIFRERMEAASKDVLPEGGGVPSMFEEPEPTDEDLDHLDDADFTDGKPGEKGKGKGEPSLASEFKYCLKNKGSAEAKQPAPAMAASDSELDVF
jgi:hypothetical protein